jgi:CheY-like chemotaxis protein
MREVLLVEDDVDTLELFTDLLEVAGLHVFAVASLADARALLHRARFDLVITDVLVDARDPDDGWRDVDDLIRLARPTPVAVVSALAAPPSPRPLAFALVKPISDELLLASVARCLGLG